MKHPVWIFGDEFRLYLRCDLRLPDTFPVHCHNVCKCWQAVQYRNMWGESAGAVSGIEPGKCAGSNQEMLHLLIMRIDYSKWIYSPFLPNPKLLSPLILDMALRVIVDSSGGLSTHSWLKWNAVFSRSSSLILPHHYLWCGGVGKWIQCQETDSLMCASLAVITWIQTVADGIDFTSKGMITDLQWMYK